MFAVAYQSELWAAAIVVSRASECRGEQNGDLEPWIDLDRQLRSVAARRAALDHEELTLIRKAMRVQLWRHLGMTSMREYLEKVMGHGPHAASERLRVVAALDDLPEIETALASSALSYSAVRELTRIATRKTECEWLEACRGKNLRQIEELVAERDPGDAPSDRPKPDVRPERVSMMLRPAPRALLRSARQAIEAARGERIDDNDLIEALYRAYVAASAGGDGHSGPRAQIAITQCEACGQAWQHAAGRMVAITEAEYETAACDAVMIGSLDGAPARATSTIPPAMRRLVLHRDGGRCTIPGCRASVNIDVHHIRPRVRGGGHEPENLTSLCSGHHNALHRGELAIEGKAPAITVTWRWKAPPVEMPVDDSPVEVSHVGKRSDEPAEVSHVGKPSGDPAAMISHVGERAERGRDAVLALTTLGFTKPVAVRAVEAARDALDDDAPLEALLRAALGRCPR